MGIRDHIQMEAAPAAAAPGPGQAVRERRIFISYAHADGAKDGDPELDLPLTFHLELQRLCEDHPEYGVPKDGIFFDRRGLPPGSLWAQTIATALAASDIVFFLVSRHSLNSSFCMNEEVGRAVAAGKLLVPVVLTDCRWSDRLLNAGTSQYRLGDFQAVPKDAQFKLQPVELWPHANSAWRAVIEQVQRVFSAPPAPPQPVAKAESKGLPALSELLPFTCNQVPVASHFQLSLKAWQNQALLVLLKGVYEDEMPSFLRRLAEVELARRCEKAGLAVLQRRPVKGWPDDDDELLAESVRMALSQALTQDPDGLNNGAELAAALAKEPGVRPLLLGVLRGGPALAKSLQAALALVEAAPPDAPLQRLLLVLTVEDPALVAEADLGTTLGLRGFARTHVVELKRMSPLDEADVGQWFEEHGLQDHYAEGRPAFVQRTFEGKPELRMRPFAQSAQRLLQLK